MANDYYYMSGYMPPQWVSSRDQVREIQRQLNTSGANLAQDGIWGPKTSAAYTAGGGTSLVIPAQYKNYLSELQTLLAPQNVQYTPTPEAQYLSQIQTALRPGYDLALSQRKNATRTHKAEIDADAAARSMGSSTWVTDVKDRQSGYEADDIATMEGQYSAAVANALMNAMQTEKANQLAVSQSNAQLAANAQAQALGLAGDFYSQYLASSKKSNTSGKSADDGKLLAEALKLSSDPGVAYEIFMGRRSEYGKRYNVRAIQTVENALKLLADDAQ